MAGGGGGALPIALFGTVAKGFQRGSKQLGFPTANIEPRTEEGRRRVQGLRKGVYYGWCLVSGRGGGQPRPAAVSVGDNPHYGDLDGRLVVEAHIIHKFSQDFYGEDIACILCGYIRPMEKYDSLDLLIKAITADVDTTKAKLAPGTDGGGYIHHPFLRNPTAEGAASLPPIRRALL